MISTHILNTHLGKPADGVRVKLFFGDKQLLAESITNQDGRVSDFNLSRLDEGEYHLEFATAEYFSKLNIDTFFPKIVIYFSIHNAQQHYHVPLLINGFSYSTYRGS